MKNQNQWKPFASVTIIIATLFSIVFFKMEERRLGYEALQLSRVEKRALEDQRIKQIELIKLIRPQHVKMVASTKLTLRRPEPSQIIHLTGDSWMVGVR